MLLTGRAYDTRVHIQNLEPRARKGRLAFTWTVADQTSSPLVATFNLSASAASDFIIPGWRPTREGYAELRLHLYIARVNGTLESNLEEPADRFGGLAAGVRGELYTLFSAAVHDASEWGDEKRWQAEQRRKSNLLILLAGVAAIAGVATVLLILFVH